MKAQSSPKQRFVDYLQKHLCETNHFSKVGPRSFLFKDDRDTIFVKVNDGNLIIVTDGENVVDHIEMIYLCIDREEEEAAENEVFDSYLQQILLKF